MPISSGCGRIGWQLKRLQKNKGEHGIIYSSAGVKIAARLLRVGTSRRTSAVVLAWYNRTVLYVVTMIEIHSSYSQMVSDETFM